MQLNQTVDLPNVNIVLQGNNYFIKQARGGRVPYAIWTTTVCNNVTLVTDRRKVSSKLYRSLGVLLLQE